ncbi:MAG: RtcB family protein [Candidatus Omnitrophica bacterium]|nr:RtcB family protein [Candidatus Omnitrophota bacterium]
MNQVWQGRLEKIDDYRWKIPRSYKPGMKVPGLIIASDSLIPSIINDKAVDQVANVAFLPGIVRYSLAMPDIHWGYGFSIGGVAATDPSEGGVISPGGVGYDINCGVRLLRSELLLDEVKPKLEKLVNALFSNIPCGVGSSGDIRVSHKEEEEIFIKGAGWAVKKGYGVKEDLECTEDNGAIKGADPGGVSDRAFERGRKQSGTLGSGNHFLEVQIVDEIYDDKKADIFGLFKGQITVMIHSGSRGFGYQVCDDYVKSMVTALRKYNINVPDRQLACVPLDSPEGKAYMGGMRCAANYAWNNRQCLTYLIREVFERIFNKSWTDLGLALVYDVAHNIAKMERHVVDGKERFLCVHRKGATRAFPPHHVDIPEKYIEAGQPVIIPGDMGSFSYILAGTEAAMTETFGSTCHGAGRNLSRSAAIKRCEGRQIDKELFNKSGIIVRASGRSTLAEEAPEAYKDVKEVVEVVHRAGISTKVARMRPLGVIKG